MTNQNPTLTAANIRYLLVIRELDAEERGARCIDVTARLGAAKPGGAACRNAVCTVHADAQVKTGGTRHKTGFRLFGFPIPRPCQSRFAWNAGRYLFTYTPQRNRSASA